MKRIGFRPLLWSGVAILCLGALPSYAQLQPPQTVISVPTPSSSAGINPVASAALEASHVFKTGPGTLYDLEIATSSVAGYLLLFDATSDPADGAVTPLKCFGLIPTTSTTATLWPAGGIVNFKTGLVAVFSTSGCFTKAESATAYFSGDVK